MISHRTYKQVNVNI